MTNKKYVPVRMPIKAYKKYVVRQQKLQEMASKITRKIIRIPLTRIFEISADNPISLTDERLIGIVRKRKK